MVARRKKKLVWNCDQGRRQGEVDHNQQNRCATESLPGHGRGNYGANVLTVVLDLLLTKELNW